MNNNACDHRNKVATDGYNQYGEIYWECPDCGRGWRAEPETDEEWRLAENISDEMDALDAKALGIDLDLLLKENTADHGGPSTLFT